MIEQRLKFLYFPLALMAIGSLALVPGVSAPYIGAFMLILLPGFFLNPKNEPFSGYSIAWHVAVVVFLLWTTGHLVLTGHGLHITLSYQLSFVILYRMLTPKKPRHYQEIWYWCLSSMILAGFWTMSIVFIGVVAVFTVVSVFAFSYASLLREQERLETGSPSAPDAAAAAVAPVRRGRSAALPVFLSALTLIILGLSIATFVALPRRGMTTLALASESPVGERDIILTGLSDYISLGSLGKILEDDSEALRVTVSPPPLDARNLYLRGGVLDYFVDGLHWQKSPYLSRTLNAAPRQGPPAPPASGVEAPSGHAVTQKIVYTGLMTNTVYALPNVTRLRLDHPGQFSVNPAGVILLRTMEREFEAESNPWNLMHPNEMPIVAPLFPALEMEPDSAVANPLYLQLPESLQSLTFQHFAWRVTAGAESPAHKAAMIERYLESRYSYTLDLRGYRSNNPVEEFLFERQEGHCELFATSMVMMLRAVGVPSRLVSGFRGGVAEPEAGPGQFLVRNRDVHTWVEAWSPEDGWRQYDPTPPAPLEVFGGSLAFLTLRRWAEVMQRKANHFVFSFNREQQTNLLGVMRQVTLPALVMMWTLESQGLLMWVSVIPAAALAWLIVWLGRRWLRRVAWRRSRGATQRESFAANDAFLVWLRGRLLALLGGSPKAMDQDRTLREYALGLARHRPNVRMDEVRDLTSIYYALRFGAQPLTPTLRDDIRRRLEQLKA